MSVAGIYSRKSLFTGKGESVKNQIDACQEYAAMKGWDSLVYFDEGFSGQNQNRPGFQQLLQDIDQGKIQHVIFYKLDRISRRMLDILEFIEKMNSKGIDFISITENFDTTTPLGRAMVHIAATFAQLEREMLQQRVRDNMIQLAKTGRWLGGIAPTGYTSKEMRFRDHQGKEKRKYILEGIPEELAVIEKIYTHYLKKKSLSQVEKYLLAQGFQTKNGGAFQKQTIRSILMNPVYVKADPRIFDYFRVLQSDIASPIEAFDGIHGLLTYNKNRKSGIKGTEPCDPEHWIVTVGDHNGIIDASDWIAVQKQISKNSKPGVPWKKSSHALLSGLLRCKYCGGPMIIRYGQKDKKNGHRFYYYVCQQKDLTGGAGCSNRNIRGDLLDQTVLETLVSLAPQPSQVKKILEKVESKFLNSKRNIISSNEDLNKQIHRNRKRIQQLLSKLERNIPDAAAKHIGERIEELDHHISELEKKMEHRKIVEQHPSMDLSPAILKGIRENVASIGHVVNSMESVEEKRRFVEGTVERILYHEGAVEIHLKKNAAVQ
ncbi:Site-specific DNA recombinase [Geosporobacter subterraneus DSM 17957]|uniref:Site-specific DNA recombinase n=1 Tax=Geosporobacter subterraneus DSM 17957 TaxID=1121919 RepID=A0A1M6BYK8_9FIRM|nr:recombinase family protein [Geosporobacter subterraneus]SHI53866.1 Site-specific DNA recombinase [Geosporobacter subterraneus DSM 17957]